MSTINARERNKEVGNKLVVEVPSEVLGARAGLLNDSRAIDYYLLIVNVDDGHCAFEISRCKFALGAE
jgi:hypothetical protein